MAYNITTFVNNLNKISLFDDIMTVLFLVHSKSNYIPQNTPVGILDTDDLALYFPDCIEEDNEELQLINRLLGQGYRVIAINIASTINKETLLLSQKDNGDFEEHWYDANINLGYIGVTPRATENLAVKIDLNSIRHVTNSKFYFILEHKINGQLLPICIYNGYSDIPIIPFWSPAHEHNLNLILDWEWLGTKEGIPVYGNLTDESAENLAKVLMEVLSREQYTCVYDSQERCVYAAYSYPFVDFTTKENINIEWAPNFNDIYLTSAVPPEHYVLRLESIYNSDLADIEVDIYKRRNVYYLDVVKNYADSVCNIIESYSGTNADEIVKQVNDLSDHVTITNFRSSIPEGKFFLRQQNPVAPLKIKNYYEGLEALRNLLTEEELYYYFNLFYEPDVRYLIEGSQVEKNIAQSKIQDLVKNIFDTTDLANMPIVKLMSYLENSDSIGTLYYSYFVDCTFMYNNNKVSGKALFLELLTSNSLETTIGPELELLEDLPEELPFFVNTLRQNYRNFNVDEFKVVYGEHTFDVKNIIVISSMNILLYSVLGNITPAVVQDQKNVIEQYFIKYFNSMPSINISKYEQDGNVLHLSVEYSTNNLQEVNTVDLVLNLS